jgi:hypothetical protein
LYMRPILAGAFREIVCWVILIDEIVYNRRQYRFPYIHQQWVTG